MSATSMLLRASASGRAFRLEWTQAPPRTQSYVATVEVPMSLDHQVLWLRYDVPPSANDLETAATSLGLAGAHDLAGPGADPTGPYRFRVHALDRPSLDLPPGATLTEVQQRMKGHVLATAEQLGDPPPVSAPPTAAAAQRAARPVLWNSLLLYGLGPLALVVLGIAGIYLAPLLAAVGVVLLALWIWLRAAERRQRRLAEPTQHQHRPPT